MALDLADYESKARSAVKAFWRSRNAALTRQKRAGRSDLLCRKLMQERLYTAACVLASPRSALKTGQFTSMSDMAGLGTFIATLAGHIASEAARRS